MRRNRKKRSSLSDYQFRSDLRRLMGSEVIHLNDRKWNEELERRIHEELEKRMDQHEDSLAEAEVMRIRKLKIDGIISHSDEDVDDSENTRRKAGKSNGKRHKKKHRKRSQSPKNSKRCSSAPSRSITWYKAPEDISTQVELMEDSRSEKEKRVDEDASSGQGRTSSDRKLQETSRPHTQEQRTKRRVRKQVPEDIQELYDEESVDGLYSLAEKLIIVDSGPKVRVKVESY